MKNILPILMILYVKSIYFLIARGVQLDNGVDPLCVEIVGMSMPLIQAFLNVGSTLVWS